MSGPPDSTTAALLDALRPLVAEIVEEELARRLFPEDGPAWLTIEEYAERMRTTVAAVHKRRERGRIPGAVKEGNRWLFPAAATLPSPENEGRAPRERPRPGTRR